MGLGSELESWARVRTCDQPGHQSIAKITKKKKGKKKEKEKEERRVN
jgi:hypothetical protein